MPRPFGDNSSWAAGELPAGAVDWRLHFEMDEDPTLSSYVAVRNAVRAGMWWFQPSSNTIFRRNSTNTAWTAVIVSGESVSSLSIFGYQVENLTAGDDIGDGTAANARSIFFAPAALTVSKISIVSQGTAVGVDASNTVTIKVYRGTNLIVSKTYNNATPFPADHTESDLGSLSNNVFSQGDDLRFDIVCGATANVPSFMLQVKI